MEIREIFNHDSLRDWFVFANTPYYLYRHFKEDNSILEVANAFDSLQIISEFDNLIREKPKNLDDLVTLYALVIALTFKNYSEVKEFFSKLDNYSFIWFKEIKDIYFDSLSLTQEYDIVLKQNIEISQTISEIPCVFVSTTLTSNNLEAKDAKT